VIILKLLRSLSIFVCLVYLISCKTAKLASGDKKIETNKPTSSALSEAAELQFGRAFIDGCTARQKNDVDAAIKFFTECKQIDPKSAPVAYELAKIYLEKNSPLLAIEQAKFCAASDLKNEYYQKILIDAYNANKQFQQAIKVAELLVKNFPNVIEFKEDLAIQYAGVNEFNKAFNLYNEIEKIYGFNEQITNNKVKLLRNQNKFSEAEAELIKLTETDKLNTDYLAILAEFYEEAEKRDKAKLIYDRILEINPSHPTVNLALSDYYNLQQSPQKGFEFLKKAFQNPDLDPSVKANIAFNYYIRSEKSGNPETIKQGKELANIFITVHPKNSDANGVFADYLMLDNKPKEAAKFYYQAAASEKSNYKVWEQLMYVYNDISNFDSLKSVSVKAIELFPNQPNPYFFNGISNIKLKKYDQAITALKDGLEFVIDNKVQMLSFYYNLAEAYNYSNDYTNSDKAFEDALKIDSDNTLVLNNYAYYLSVRKSKLDIAEKMAKRSNELQPNNRNYMDTYGWILFQQKKYVEAEVWIANALKIPPPNANILEHYGDVMFKLNKTSDALKYWQEAKKLSGGNDKLNLKISSKEIID
jgi:tetratricopeptide (TPR) repeat protein